MMGRRDKGPKAELEVARLLEPWWRQLEPGATFVRTPRSGGWTQGRDLFDARGDLCVKGAPRFPWLVEVKRREAWSLSNFELGRACPVWGWWERANHDAACAGRTPMLWIRHNRRPWIIVVSEYLSKKMFPDFAWDCLPFDRESNIAWPRAFWLDKFLGSHPRRWVEVT